MPSSLEDMGYTTAAQSGGSDNITMADIYGLDVRVIFNKSIYQFLANYALYYFDVDAMIFSSADSDVVLAMKQTFLQQALDTSAAYLRTQFPQLVL
jgi:hypothetical protein